MTEKGHEISFGGYQSSSVAQLCPTLCNPMNRSTPGLPVHHQLLEFTRTHVHRVGDAIQPSHPRSSPSSPVPNPSQHQSLFQWVNSAWGGQTIGVSASTSVLPVNTLDWSPLGWTGWISLQSKGLSRVFSNTTVQKYQFSGAQLSSQSNSHIHTWPLEKTIALTRWTFVGKVMSLLFNMLSRLVITFLPRSTCLNFMATITICSDFRDQKNKVWHCQKCSKVRSLAQVYKLTKTCWTVPSKFRMNCVVYKWYLNEVVKQKN